MPRVSSGASTSSCTGRFARCALAALALFSLAPATSARAHGGPPAILQIVAADAEGPRLLRLNEGFALRLGARWIYVCPSLFGTTEVPRAVALGEMAWLASTEGTFTLDAEGRVHEIEGDGALIALAVAGGEVFGLRFRLQSADVLRLTREEQQLVHASDEPFVLLSAGGAGLLLARAESDALHVQELELSGATAARWSVAIELTNALVTLRSAEGAAFVDTLDLEGHVLSRLAGGELTTVLDAPGLILGPTLADDGRLWMSTHDSLWRVDDDVTTSGFAAPRWLTCLDRVADQTFACAQDQVLAFVGPELGELRMDLRELEPPQASDGDLLGDAQCAADWLLFQSDLESIGIGASDAGAARMTAKPIKRGGAGCSLAGTALQPRSSACAWLALAMLIATCRHRVRQRRPRGLL